MIAGGPPVHLRPCPPHESSPSRPDPRPRSRASTRATRSCWSTASDLRDVIAYQLHADGPRVELEVRRGGLERTLVGRQGRRRTAGSGARERGLRSRAHVRQPLPVLLHLPAAERHAEEPLPEGRRLPVVVPLRELHDAHALHRGRHGTGDHRAARPPLREHPRHRSRCAQPLAAEPARRDQPALARAAARRGHRSPRPGRRVSGDQRRRRCSTTRCSACSIGSRRSRRSAWSRSVSARTTTSRRCVRTHAPKPRPTSTPSNAGRRATSPRSATASSTPPTSTTCSPERPFPALDDYDACAQHENGIGMARTFEAEVRAALAGDEIETTGVRSGFFAWVDGAPADGYRAPRTQSVRPVGAVAHGDGGRPSRHDSHGHARRAGARAVAARASGQRRAAAGREPVLRRQHRRHRPPDRRRSRPRARRRDAGARYLLPDVALSRGRFLDGTTVDDLPHPVEIVATDGASLVAALRS